MKIFRGPQSESDERTAQQRRDRAEQVRWVLNFLCRDLGTLTKTDWSHLQRELDHLTWTLVDGGKVVPASWLRQLESPPRAREQTTMSRDGWCTESAVPPFPFLDERENERAFRARLPTLTRKQLRQVQARLGRVLEALRSVDAQGEPVGVAYPSIPGAITRVHLMNDWSQEDSGLGITRVYGADWRHLRWLAIASLLEEFGTRIVRCRAPSCPHLFLRHRRQRYCSPQCSQKVRSTTWYQKHQETAKARRREAYSAYQRRARTRAPGREREPA